MAGFDHASVEILQMVVSHVKSLDDLSSLSLVCSRLHRIVDYQNRRKYHRICLTTVQSLTLAYDLMIDLIRYPYLRHYVRQLEVDEDKFVVRRLTFNRERFPQIYSEATVAMMADPDAAVIRPAIAAAGIVDEELAERYLVHLMMCKAEHQKYLVLTRQEGLISPCEVFSVLFLSLANDSLDNLWHETVRPSSPSQQYLGCAGTSPISSDASFLGGLTKVRVYPHEKLNSGFSHYGFLDMATCFLHLPAIETIRFGSMYPLPDERLNGRLAPRRSNVSNIYIDHSSVHHSWIARVIAHSKQLKEFIYTVGHPVDWDHRRGNRAGYGDIVPETLVTALLRHRHTLRVLDLDGYADIQNRVAHDAWLPPAPGFPSETQEASEDDDNERAVVWRRVALGGYKEIGSLTDFTALTHFTIGVQLLLGKHDHDNGRNDRRNREDDHDNGDIQEGPEPAEWFRLVGVLPPNLEYICIRGYSRGSCRFCDRRIPQLVERRDEWFPRLREIRGVDSYVEGPADGD